MNENPTELKPPLDPRVRLAAERTLLAWIRTGLSLMGFGFVVARFGLFLREMAAVGHTPPSSGLSQWIGVALVLLGVIVNLLAAFSHIRMLERFEQGIALPTQRWSLGVIVTIVLAVMGLGMAIYLLATSRA